MALVAPRNSRCGWRSRPTGWSLEAGGGDEAQASEGLDCAYEGEPMTIAFNPAYLLDGLGAIDSDDRRGVVHRRRRKPAVLTGKRSGDADAAAPATTATC